jgi:hypothetical protein
MRCIVCIALLCTMPSLSLLMPGYEKFSHYTEMPPEVDWNQVQNRHYMPQLIPNQASANYSEQRIFNQMSGGPQAIPLLEYNQPSIIRIARKNRAIDWVNQNFIANNGNRLTIQEMANMALARELRGVPIKFNPEFNNENQQNLPTEEQFRAGGYGMPLARSLYQLNTGLNLNYITTENNEHIASEVVLHFNLRERVSKNARDLQTSGYAFLGQNTIRSHINNQLYIYNLRFNQNYNISSASIISYIARQPNE